MTRITLFAEDLILASTATGLTRLTLGGTSANRMVMLLSVRTPNRQRAFSHGDVSLTLARSHYIYISHARHHTPHTTRATPHSVRTGGSGQGDKLGFTPTFSRPFHDLQRDIDTRRMGCARMSPVVRGLPWVGSWHAAQIGTHVPESRQATAHRSRKHQHTYQLRVLRDHRRVHGFLRVASRPSWLKTIHRDQHQHHDQHHDQRQPQAWGGV